MPRWLTTLAVVLASTVAGAALGFLAGWLYPRLMDPTDPVSYEPFGVAGGALLGFTLGWLRRAEGRAAI